MCSNCGWDEDYDLKHEPEDDALDLASLEITYRESDCQEGPDPLEMELWAEAGDEIARVPSRNLTAADLGMPAVSWLLGERLLSKLFPVKRES